MAFGVVTAPAKRNSKKLDVKAFGTVAQSYDFVADLSLYTTGRLLIDIHWVVAALSAGNVDLSLRLNGGAATIASNQTLVAYGTTNAARTTDTVLFSGKDTDAAYSPIVGTIAIEGIGTVLQRSVWVSGVGHQTTAQMQLAERFYRITSPATGVQLTSIGVSTNVADSIGVGSYFTLTWVP